MAVQMRSKMFEMLMSLTDHIVDLVLCVLVFWRIDVVCQISFHVNKVLLFIIISVSTIYHIISNYHHRLSGYYKLCTD